MTRVRFELVLPDSAGVRAEIGGQNFALSPDGARIVYLGGAGNDQLYQRGMNDLDARPIRGTEQARYPRFSPDGQWVGFVQSGRLKKIPLSGGPAVPIAENVTHVSWGERDVIAFTGAGTLWRVSATGGVPGRVATLDTTRGETSIWPHVLPGGRSAVFGIVTAGDIASTELAGVGFDEREVLRLGVTGTNPRYLASGHLILGRLDGTVIALPFDVGRMRVTGPAVTVLDGVYVKSGGATELGVSGDGTLAYIEGQSRAQLVLVNHAGGARPLLPTLREYGYPRYSPVGGRIVFQMADPGGFSRTDIWVYNDLTRTLARLTNDGRNSRPAWSADGRHVMWLYRDTAGGTTLRRQMWGGTDKPEQLLPGLAISEVTQSPSGKFHVGTTRRPGTGVDIWIADGDPPSAPRFLVATPASEGGPQVSPDGRWIAYFGDESEQREVYVTAVTGRGGRHQISKAGGAEPAWAPDGRSLYYRTAGRRMVARISTSPAFVVTRRDTVFSDNFRASAPRPSMTCPAMEGNS
jgi:Tol biopolymer transport system component